MADSEAAPLTRAARAAFTSRELPHRQQRVTTIAELRPDRLGDSAVVTKAGSAALDAVGAATSPELSRGWKSNPLLALTGIHHVSVPTGTRFAAVLIEERESEVATVLLQYPCGARVLLRRAAAPVVALRGYPWFGLTIASYAELQRWVQHLTAFDVEHTAVHEAHPGWAVTVTGPDLVGIQLQTDEGPSGEDD